MDAWFQSLLGNEIGIVVSIIVKIILILVPIILVVVPYLTYFERKVIGYMQLRVGPNVNGPYGLLQPYLDVVKLLVKEIIVPTKSNKMLLMVAPAMVLAPSLAIWVTLPMSREWVMTNLNAGLLYVLALSSVGVYGVILAGWASNSKYAFLGAMRSSAQMISYEIAMGFCLVAAVMVSGSLNFQDIVAAQATGKMGGSFLSWNWLPLLPLFIVYLVCGVAETNRAPFDVAEGESEIVAGFHIEYSGFAFALFFLAEYINMIIFSALLSLLFLGGWLSPFPESWGFIGKGSALWMFLKMGAILFFYLWLRATFPRYRYDQIMRLGWKVFIPVTLVYLIIVMAWMKTPWNIWV